MKLWKVKGFEVLKVSSLKLIYMALAMVVLQFSFERLSADSFVLLNKMIFFVGLHTCVTYSVQVGIWESKGALNWRSMVGGLLVAVLMAMPVLYFEGGLVFAALAAYVIYKFLDRLAFNCVLSEGRAVRAYLVVIFFMAFEAVVWLLCGGVGEVFARFIIPSLVVSVVVLVFLLGSGGGKFLKGLPASGMKEKIYFSLHSFFLLAVIMLDRLVVGKDLSGFGMQGKDYLLLFSYGGAIYSLMISALEVKRVQYFEVAKQAEDLKKFIRRIGFYRVLLLSVTVNFLVALGMGGAWHLFGGRFLDVPISSFWAVWGAINVFYLSFFVCAIFHIFYLANRRFIELFLVWGGGLAVKMLLLLGGGLESYLVINVIAGLVCVILSLVIGVPNAKDRFFR